MCTVTAGTPCRGTEEILQVASEDSGPQIWGKTRLTSQVMYDLCPLTWACFRTFSKFFLSYVCHALKLGSLNMVLMGPQYLSADVLGGLYTSQITKFSLTSHLRLTPSMPVIFRAGSVLKEKASWMSNVTSLQQSKTGKGPSNPERGKLIQGNCY